MKGSGVRVIWKSRPEIIARVVTCALLSAIWLLAAVALLEG